MPAPIPQDASLHVTQANAPPAAQARAMPSTTQATPAIQVATPAIAEMATQTTTIHAPGAKHVCAPTQHLAETTNHALEAQAAQVAAKEK
jgi:hypothetical protein